MNTTTQTVRDARPPAAVIMLLNPIMRRVLRTPLGRAIKPFALLEFTGRRSGRRYRVPVGWHAIDGTTVVFTPASWSVNFAAAIPVEVRHRGRVEAMTGTLVTDPDLVASALNTLFTDGAPPRAVGLDMQSGHTVTATDVVAVNRAMIRFTRR